MKILFTGGGTGGHFYPIIAIAEEVNKIVDQEKILEAKLYYMSDKPYDKEALFENGLEFVEISAGKLRLYQSKENIFDMFKTAIGCLQAIFKLFSIYPDVVFGKGGYASFPTLVAARILRIPVFIHESDSIPGRVNKWAGKFAKRIAISYDEAIEFFPKEKTAWIGQPIRMEIQQKANQGALEYLKLESDVPVIFIVGGSLGAEIINNTVIDDLPDLLNRYQIIHQVGPNNFKECTERVSVVLDKHPYANRYKMFGTLNPLALKMAAGAATLVVSRAGSMIFEIAGWGVPSIIIPIDEKVSHDQKSNAFNYARAGACAVIEDNNLTPTILRSEIDKLIANKARLETMSKNALAFAKPGAAAAIARELVNMAIEHEK